MTLNLPHKNLKPYVITVLITYCHKAKLRQTIGALSKAYIKRTLEITACFNVLKNQHFIITHKDTTR